MRFIISTALCWMPTGARRNDLTPQTHEIRTAPRVIHAEGDNLDGTKGDMGT